MPVRDARLSTTTSVHLSSATARALWGQLPTDAPPLLGVDIVVSKTRFSGFWVTNLDAVLRDLHVHCLIFARESTSICVESTVRDATCLEYNCLTLSDCTADMFGQEAHDAALKRLGLWFG